MFNVYVVRRFARWLISCQLCLATPLSVTAQHELTEPEHTLVFRAGDCGSRYYRIPALITAADGSLIAVADRRNDSQGDLPNQIDLVMRRSTDNGSTWSEQVVIAQHTPERGYGDAALVVDRITGDLLCIFASGCGMWASTTEHPTDVCIARSRDNGLTWSDPRYITSQIYGSECSNPGAKNLSGLFAASGCATQLRDGTLAFVVAAHRTSEKWPPLYNHVCCSADGGETWRLLSTTPGPYGDEAKLVECNDGTWLMSIRNPSQGYRRYAVSHDQGVTWSDVREWRQLPDPACNGDMIRFSQGEGQPEVLLHSIPADTVMRRNVSIAVSYDEGRTWPVRKTVWNREAGYSSLTRLEDGSIGLLTEVGDWESGFEIWFTRLSFEWLTDKTNGEQFACDNDDE